jgi:hypothetical protein
MTEGTLPPQQIIVVHKKDHDGGWTFVGFLVLAAILLWADNQSNGIFPDPVYCYVGAGFELVTPAQTKPSSWEHVPASSRCVHSTIWAAIQNSEFYKTISASLTNK